MKKIVFYFVGILMLGSLLTACQTTSHFGGKKEVKKDSTELAWLAGTWYSADWDVTYTFIEDTQTATWSIRNGQDLLVEGASVKTSHQSKQISLIAKNKTTYQIEKIDETHLKFQQKPAKGLMGLTDQVQFVKK